MHYLYVNQNGLCYVNVLYCTFLIHVFNPLKNLIYKVFKTINQNFWSLQP